MINLKSLMSQILDDERLVSLVGENIYDAYPDTVELFPCVIYLDSGQSDMEFADNKPLADNCEVEIHIFTKSLEGYPTTSEIGITVDEIMKENFFSMISNSETPDVVDDVRHRVMRYRKIILF